MSEWISIEDEMPDKPRYYLTFEPRPKDLHGGEIFEEFKILWRPPFGDKFAGEFSHGYAPTHWMPLPEPPK